MTPTSGAPRAIDAKTIRLLVKAAYLAYPVVHASVEAYGESSPHPEARDTIALRALNRALNRLVKEDPRAT